MTFFSMPTLAKIFQNLFTGTKVYYHLSHSGAFAVLLFAVQPKLDNDSNKKLFIWFKKLMMIFSLLCVYACVCVRACVYVRACGPS